jgi:hypothetical protein
MHTWSSDWKRVVIIVIIIGPAMAIKHNPPPVTYPDLRGLAGHCKRSGHGERDAMTRSYAVPLHSATVRWKREVNAEGVERRLGKERETPGGLWG